MPVQMPDVARSMMAASSMARTGMALSDYAQKSKHRDAVKDARENAIDSGTPEAIQVLIKLDPGEAESTINALSTMDKRQRETTKANAERTAKSIMWVEQGQSPDEKSQRWDEVVDFMVKNGNDNAEQYRGKYSPDLSQHLIMKAMTIDDINDQFSFGQLKVAEKDGKPVYIQTNPAGQTREAPVPEGVKPTDKEAYGTKKGGDNTLKAADENSMKSSVAGLYGGTYDPQTGRISGLEKEQQAKVLAISARATRIYSDANGSKTRTEAAAEAARELGVAVPKVKASSIQDYLDKERANNKQ